MATFKDQLAHFTSKPKSIQPKTKPKSVHPPKVSLTDLYQQLKRKKLDGSPN